jgi:hypothetical protein
MRSFFAVAFLLAGSLSAVAQGIKPCDELKAEIAKKLDAKGLQSYSLDIVAKDKEAEGKQVGTCEGGMKKIVYSKTPAQPKPAAKAAKKQ